jgi:hypothetical protein
VFEVTGDRLKVRFEKTNSIFNSEPMAETFAPDWGKDAPPPDESDAGFTP